MLHNIHFTTTLQWIPIFAADCIIGTKRLGLIYGSSNFYQENTWDEKRWWSSYSSGPLLRELTILNTNATTPPSLGWVYSGGPNFVGLFIIHLSMSKLSCFADGTVLKPYLWGHQGCYMMAKALQHPTSSGSAWDYHGSPWTLSKKKSPDIIICFRSLAKKYLLSDTG